MIKAIGVKFPYSLKVYDFSIGEKRVEPRDMVVVETTQGMEVGEVIYIDKKIKEDPLNPIKEICRVAEKGDIEKTAQLEEKSKELVPIFRQKIEKYGLKMNPVGCSYSLDETKAIFYFTAEGRVDFRELARDLSRTLQKQAILRQIGPRDEAKLIGGFGRCGRPLCCSSFLSAVEGVSMETVERQFGMPKNASKISGACGRLMCCLNYEGQGKKEIQEEIKENLSRVTGEE